MEIWREDRSKKSKMKLSIMVNNRHLTVTYGCSKLYDTPKPTDGDICESCAGAGFTKERNCEYQGLEFSLEKTLSSYNDCLAWCNDETMLLAS